MRSVLWRRIVRTPEWEILLAGIGLVGLYVLVLLLIRDWSSRYFNNLLLMASAQVLAGRAAGMSVGYEADLAHWLVILFTMMIETSLVLLFYPLFVFSYKRLFVIKPLKETMARARRAAVAHRKQVMRYGIPGLLLFVFFPFWMTGPLIGCVLGYLMGLRPIVNLTVVLAGTGVAIVCWGLLLQKISNRLKALGPYMPWLFIGAIVLFALALQFRSAFARKRKEETPADSGRS